jgi:DNA-binding MarR family transcriptional regulator
MARARDIDLADYVPYLVNRVGSALVTRFSDEALAPHRLTIAMWRVLVALSHAGVQRQIDLAQLTSIDVSTLSRLVARLVQRGLVSRQRSASSSREVSVALTSKGTKLVNALIPIALRLERSALTGVPAAELAAIKRGLRTMHRNLSRPGETDRA